MKTKITLGNSVNTKVKSSVSITLLLSLYCSTMKLVCRPLWDSINNSIRT